MRRLIALLWALVLLLTSCGAQQREPADDGTLSVVSTLFPYYDFARAIGGSRVQVTLLLSPGRESHSYEPTPLDVIRISEADVFLYNGGEGETWVDETLEGLEAPGQVRERMMDHVDALEEELAEGMEAEGGHGEEDDGHGHEIEYDEHIWTSPVNAMALAEAVCGALSQADPEGAEYYASNLADYQAQLQSLDEEFRDVVAHAKRRILIFADRFPLLYFCKTYGLDYRAAFQGCSGDTEPSVRTLAYLIDKVQEEQIPVVYHLELSSEKISGAVCESTGAKPLKFHSCHNVTRAEFEGGATYLSLMQANVEALKEGLQ
ncbi:zinc ABC transporter substrate-binding protein [Oscillibacter hominis]|uniref:Zinc ABC transporter substrate-binding protein n=1 Tax=Oscillibacter hominis TaxID=2763056 RepID=A0A7G9B2N5_9FIRM|nr:metal ABC transporter substrate-binding protein [Oscillibacter hominis]QNL43816.1 zinc ABC transporter substrate-binding protein [Oscillibacter hominis]